MASQRSFLVVPVSDYRELGVSFYSPLELVTFLHFMFCLICFWGENGDLTHNLEDAKHTLCQKQ